MGLRYRKSIKIAPGLKLNFGKTGAGVSAGAKGTHVSVNSSGRVSTSTGIPGSGLSYTTSSGGTRRRNGCLIPTVIFLAMVGFIFYGFSSCFSHNPKPRSSVTDESSLNPGTKNQDSTTTVIPGELDDAERRTDALECIENFLAEQGFEIIEAKKTSRALTFSVSMSEISNLGDLDSAPSNWNEVKESILTVSRDAIEQVSDTYSGGVVIYLKDSAGDNLLTLLNAQISYDKFEAEKQVSGYETGGTGDRRVWVTDSGTKYHSKSTCSNMSAPYTLPVTEAVFRGYTSCDKCS